MSLQRKILLTVVLTFAGLILVLYLTSSRIIATSFAKLEEQQARRHIEMTLNVIKNIVEPLRETTMDWAAWDDSCAFIEGKKSDFIPVNMSDSTFINLKLGMVLFVSNGGGIVYGKAFDLKQHKEIPLPVDIRQHVGPGSPLLRHADSHDSTAGLIMLNQAPMIMAAHPIVTSNHQGPIRGTLILGTPLGRDTLQQLRKITGQTIRAHIPNIGDPASISRAASADQTDKTSITIKHLTPATIAGFATIRDLYGRPALELRVEEPRTLDECGHLLTSYFIAVILLAGVVFSLFMAWMLKKMFLNRLTHLNNEMSRIAARGEMAGQINVHGNDELSRLTAAMNQMLESLDRSGQALRQSEERMRQELESQVSNRTQDLALAITALRNEITERQRFEESLEEADRRKNEFLAMLAHELRNPLAPIRSATYLLLSAKDNDAARERKLRLIERQVEHMARLLDDLLDVSRITQGKIVLKKEKTDLGRLLDRALETTRDAIQERGHTLIYQQPPAAIWLEGDPTRLEQVFCNLIHNAAKYTEGQGTIQVTTEVEPAVDGVARPLAAIHIKDNGIGIAPDLLPHIFDLFVQADHSLERSRGGLGIGLTLVHQLLRLHDGTVEGRSEGLGLGSEFIVRLPVLAPGDGKSSFVDSNDWDSKTISSRAMTKASPGRKVLVVEDNPDTARSMAELLEFWGHEAGIALDGPAALDMARAFQPDIILLDIGLPGMDGYMVARCLRESPSLSSVLIVALTGYDQDVDRLAARESGIDIFCSKPVNLEALRNTLETAGILQLE